MITTVINSVLGFVFWLVAAHLFRADIVGVTAALVSASTIVILLSTLGVNGMLIQSMAGQKDDEEWSKTFWAGISTAVLLSLILGCITVIVLPFVARDLDSLRLLLYVALFAALTIGGTVGNVLDNVYIAERAAGNMVVRNTIVAVCKVLTVVLLIAVIGHRASNLLGAWAVASVVGVGAGALLLIRRRSPFRPSRPSTLAKAALGLKSRLAGNQLVGMGSALLPYVVPLLVTARLSASENAYFYTTWMMAGIFLIISPSVSLSLFAEGVHSPKEVLGKARAALGLIGAMVVPCLVAVFFVGRYMLSAFGAAYANHGVELLRIALVASVPDAVTNVYVSVLRVEGRLAAAASLNVAMGLGIVGLSWVFLPSVGISAVGWAFLAMQLCGCVFVVVDLTRKSLSERKVEISGRLETS